MPGLETQRPLARHQLLADRFEQWVERSPERAAVLAGEVRLTYAELDQRARELAGRLRGAGVEPREIVAIVMPRCWQAVVAILGALKVGGVFLPIDLSTPAERIQTILSSSGARVVIVRADSDLSFRVSSNLSVIAL